MLQKEIRKTFDKFDERGLITIKCRQAMGIYIYINLNHAWVSFWWELMSFVDVQMSKDVLDEVLWSNDNILKSSKVKTGEIIERVRSSTFQAKKKHAKNEK